MGTEVCGRQFLLFINNEQGSGCYLGVMLTNAPMLTPSRYKLDSVLSKNNDQKKNDLVLRCQMKITNFIAHSALQNFGTVILSLHDKQIFVCGAKCLYMKFFALQTLSAAPATNMTD